MVSLPKVFIVRMSRINIWYADKTSALSPDNPNLNVAVRNLALDHTGSIMFERIYLSRMIRYNTQDAFWGRTPNHDSAKAASRIGRLKDPNRPKKLTEEQGLQIW